MNCSTIKKYIGFPVDIRYKEEIENNLANDSYEAEIAICCVILIMQTVMASIFLSKKGGPFTSMRSTGYFSLYICLFLTNLIYLIIFN